MLHVVGRVRAGQVLVRPSRDRAAGCVPNRCNPDNDSPRTNARGQTSAGASQCYKICQLRSYRSTLSGDTDLTPNIWSAECNLKPDGRSAWPTMVAAVG